MGDAVAFFLGLIIGALGGLVPGLHSNTIISALSSSGFDSDALSIMIIALLPAHMIVSFIPAIFFGVPDTSTIVAVLPGQRMVKEGKGLEALKTVLASFILAALICTALFFVTLDAYPIVYSSIRPFMGQILLAISGVFLAKSRTPVLALLVFIASGALGQYSFNSGVADPFLPLFCGMFAIAAIANYQKSDVPEQKDTPMDGSFVPFVIIGVVLGFLADLVPGIGSPSQVATFATMFIPIDTLGYMATISSISASQTIFSLSTSASIDKTRVGGTALLAGHIAIADNLLLLLALFMAGIAFASVAVYIIRKKAAAFARLDFSMLNIVLALYLIALTILIDGIGGVGILALSTILGVLTVKLGVERTNLMGAIIVPTLLLLFRVFL